MALRFQAARGPTGIASPKKAHAVSSGNSVLEKAPLTQLHECTTLTTNKMRLDVKSDRQISVTRCRMFKAGNSLEEIYGWKMRVLNPQPGSRIWG